MDLLTQKQWFDSEEFEKEFHCDAPMGAFCGESGTRFRLWAPTARKVTLHLYEDGKTGAPTETVYPEKCEKGSWEYRTDRNLDGWYYDYEVTADGETRRTADPYAKACGVNGERSMVLDLRRTDPDGWESDRAPALTAEQVIYELHIKDFSWDPAGGFDSRDRGRFSAFLRSGITLNGDGIHPTGMDYLKNLGVTHIQILPMYDYGSVDEEQPETGYNWGYDPVNYNVPEGSYSSDPYHGEVRIRQLKEMIAALHAQGFRVIMDVVYNHTYCLHSHLFNTVPWYYYRQEDDGSASNGSGCSNDLASERSMCGKYILDSALYWVEEYHIDGFRFDLMGLLDDKLMGRIQSELDSRYGKGEKLVYGEPWRASYTCARPGTLLCDKGNLHKLPVSIGAFSDDTRDAVKGSVMDLNAVGFVNGGGITAEALRKCITGWVLPDGPNQAPSQTITYLSCHDDWTLWDKLVYTLDPDQDYTGYGQTVLQANRLAAAINFCCQGRLFIHAGEEFGRTKGGIKNSYCSSAEINQLGWTRAWKNRDLVDYYRGLIALRMQLPGLQDKSANAKNRLLWAKDLGPDCAAVCLDNGESQWSRLLMIFNCSDTACGIDLPDGNWQILADGTSSFRWQENIGISDHCTAAPCSAFLLGKPNHDACVKTL